MAYPSEWDSRIIKSKIGRRHFKEALDEVREDWVNGSYLSGPAAVAAFALSELHMNTTFEVGLTIPL